MKRYIPLLLVGFGVALSGFGLVLADRWLGALGLGPGLALILVGFSMGIARLVRTLGPAWVPFGFLMGRRGPPLLITVGLLFLAPSFLFVYGGFFRVISAFGIGLIVLGLFLAFARLRGAFRN